jgi:hypothetical protein
MYKSHAASDYVSLGEVNNKPKELIFKQKE